MHDRKAACRERQLMAESRRPGCTGRAQRQLPSSHIAANWRRCISRMFRIYPTSLAFEQIMSRYAHLGRSFDAHVSTTLRMAR